MALSVGSAAPDWQLLDTTGVSVRLGDYVGRRHVVLVLNRGLT